MRIDRRKTASLTIIASLLLTLIIFFPTNVAKAAPPEMDFWSGVSMRFGTGIYIDFFEVFDGDMNLESCDVIQLVQPILFQPYPCSWWEILDQFGNPVGEIHLDAQYGPDEWHIDTVWPGPIPPPPPGTPYHAELKVERIEPCQYYTVHWPVGWYPSVCSWWEIIDPETHTSTGWEFHVDWIYESCEFHVDEVIDPTGSPRPYILPFPWWEIEARRKITSISACDWFIILSPVGYLPPPNTWWEIIYQGQRTGLTFHLDSVDPAGAPSFHVDTSIQGVPPMYPTKARQVIPEHWYIKPPYPDYAPSGMPDFDQKQDSWGPGMGIYTWCGPVSVANSLWWFDSEYESIYNPSPVAPPTISDNFPLLSSYNPGVWDDHDPQNLDPFVGNLAFLMDADGMRTGLAHTGTNYIDMETGISQYMQQRGINPVGDCDGDGDVDLADIDIIEAAFGSMPGWPSWNMAADIVISNSIDMADLATATANIGLTGMFYEHTQEFPDFYWIEDEIHRCEDVVLFLEFWQDIGPGMWMKLYDNPSLEAGHYVTCAGVNSTLLEALISDPYHDAFEEGSTLGRSPVIHPFPHPTTIHNDTQFVSHDAYSASLWMEPPPSPYPGMPVWELMGYLQALGYDPSWHAFIRAAVVTSPLAVHDIAVTEVTTSKDGCTPKPTVSENYTAVMKVKVRNQGGYVESFFDVFCYVSDLLNTYEVGMQTISLNPDETQELTFTWDTHGFARGDYTVWAYAEPVPGETLTADNTLTDGTITITMQGDINADNIIDIFDIVRVASAFGSTPSSPAWDPNADINSDYLIDIFDIVIVALHFGESSP